MQPTKRVGRVYEPFSMTVNEMIAWYEEGTSAFQIRNSARIQELKKLRENGFGGRLVENNHDREKTA